jgi:hypothetical protein
MVVKTVTVVIESERSGICVKEAERMARKITPIGFADAIVTKKSRKPNHVGRRTTGNRGILPNIARSVK